MNLISTKSLVREFLALSHDQYDDDVSLVLSSYSCSGHIYRRWCQRPHAVGKQPVPSNMGRHKR